MIYLLLFLAAAAILAYVTSRWLRAELRELRAWLAEKWVVGRGGLSQNALIEATRKAFAARGLTPHFLLASRQAWPCYQHLRRHYLRGPPAEPLPAAVVLALGADADAGQLFLRAVVTASGEPARDIAEFFAFAEVRSLETIPARIPAGPAPAADKVLAIEVADGQYPPFDLALEPDWGPSADELARRIRALVNEGWRPDTAPAIVR